MEQTKELEANEVIQNCDAIVFGSYMKEQEQHTIMTFFKTDNKIQPTELGHKYNVLMFRKPSPEEHEVDLFTAILGDPRGYVERIGKAGYHGIVVKQKACKKKEIKAVFSKILYSWGFDAKLIKKVLKTTVV